MTGTTRPTHASRWELFRDVLTFQLKLAIDAARDIVFSPISIVAALLDVIAGDRERPYFYAVLAAGRRSESWINLFGGPGRLAPSDAGEENRNLDAVVGRVEALLVEQYERGGITAQAKHAIDRSLDALVARRSREGVPSEDSGAKDERGPA